MRVFKKAAKAKRFTIEVKDHLGTPQRCGGLTEGAKGAGVTLSPYILSRRED